MYDHVRGLLSRFPHFIVFSVFRTDTGYLQTEYDVHIMQMSPQLSWYKTCQISMLFKGSERNLSEIINTTYMEIYVRT